jgi:hypothetical protein
MTDGERSSQFDSNHDEPAFNFQWLADAEEDTPLPASAEADQPIVTTEPASSIEDWTLAQAFGQMWRTPFTTFAELITVIQMPASYQQRSIIAGARVATLPAVPPPPRPALPAGKAELPEPAGAVAAAVESESEPQLRAGLEAIQLGVRLVAFVIALIGSGILTGSANRTESTALASGLPFLIIAAALWFAVEWIGWRGWQPSPARQPASTGDRSGSMSLVWLRSALFALGLLCSGLAWTLNRDNEFTAGGFAAWMASIVLFATALAEADWHYGVALRRLVRGANTIRPRWNWLVFALVVILALGAFFRLVDLAGTPPEMTSDHVEKILDSNRVMLGGTNVFFANNGGREPTQMYLMALLAQIPGLGMNFTTLKLLSALEGLVAVLLMFWLCRAVIGREQVRLGLIVGLIGAALVAASYWHVSLSRLGLRIVLTTVIAALLLTVLSRALRDNRRNDYLLAGLVLGFGLYMYQAVRMLPVVIIVGVLLAILYRARSWRRLRDYAVNFAALVLISMVVFVPLASYSLQYPEDFWRRTQGRLLGDDIIQEMDDNGNIVPRRATMQERVDAFVENVPILLSNIRNALLMFNWKGDVAWINGAPNYPALSIVSGSLFVLGLGGWTARILQRRDPVDLLIPLMIFIMLLPSALSIAFPVENPSATRTSGALPPVYLLAAYPLGLMVVSVIRLLRGGFGVVLSVVGVSILVLGSFAQNANTYFGEYRRSYLVSSLPYTEVGRVLREFAANNGYGNAFMIAFPYWWDHRALGIEGGALSWPNGLLSVEQVPQEMFYNSQIEGDYEYNFDRDMIFFYAPADGETEQQLQEWFPNGFFTEQMTYQPEDAYRIFYVPALGRDAFSDFIERYYDGSQ